MPSKRRLAHLKSARLASVEHFKKKKLEHIHEPSESDTEQPQQPCEPHQPRQPRTRICDNQLSTNDTNNTDDTEDEGKDKGTWFWNESANESESYSECDGYSDEEGSDLEFASEHMDKEDIPLGQSQGIRWNDEGEKNLRGSYGKGSRATSFRKKKASKEWKEEGHKSYNIAALWQRSRDLGLTSKVSNESGLSEASASRPLSQVPRGCTPPQSTRQVSQEQRTVALKDMIRLLELVTEQEKKYGERFSPHGSFYYQHLMVKHFLQSQIKTQFSQRRRDVALSVAQGFGKGLSTARNIVQWENLWVDKREIPARKDRDDYFSWMDDEDVWESMRDFARRQGDRLSSYTLVQHLREYVTPEGVSTPIKIKSRTARNWLHRLGFEYKDVKKNVYVDGHERPDVIEDRAKFLQVMKDLEPYIVEFEEDGSMKAKDYLSDCAVGGDIRRPVIVITHDECTFSANDGIRKAWSQGGTFLRPKGRGQGIMASEFLLPFGRLNLSSLSTEKKKEVVEKTGLTITEAVELFEYGKSNEGYWDGSKLHKQVVSKALPIAEALYPGYSLLFLFDNATSHAVYAQDALHTGQMNKGVGGQQPWLRNGWFEKDGEKQVQLMSFQNENGVQCQKGIQRILEERCLWPEHGLRLECPKPKCFNCEAAANCKICVKGIRCDTCKEPKSHSSVCSKARKCDSCAHKAEICSCTSKEYCAVCLLRKGKCIDCEDLPPKCSSNSCCAKRLLSVQPDFYSQKCEIEESIRNSSQGQHHLILYYPKYHCELNHIEHFWCGAKQHARFWCEYSLNDLRRRVPLALESVSNYTCLAYYNRCHRKIELYRQGLAYGSADWKARTTHHKPTNSNEDR